MTLTMLFSNGDRLIVDAPIQQGGISNGNGHEANSGNSSEHKGH